MEGDEGETASECSKGEKEDENHIYISSPTQPWISLSGLEPLGL